MVFYFSGTGNSYHVAEKLAEGLGRENDRHGKSHKRGCL